MMTLFDTQKTTIAVASVLVLFLVGAFLFSRSDGGTSATDPHGTATPVADSSDDTSSQGGKSGLAAYDEDGDGVVYQGAMHPDIVRDEPGQCPVCGMDLEPVHVDGESTEEGIRVSPATLQNIGVRTTEVRVESLNRTIRTTGRFKMDERGTHTVSLKVGGWVEKLYADFEGAIVEKGQPLLELYSPELVSTQEEYLLALRNARRMEGSEDAQRLLEASRRRLAYWDLSDAQIERLEETGEPQRTITFYAPASGEVMEKNVTEGQRIESGQALMDIVDVSSIWLIADVYEQDLLWVDEGTPVRIELVSSPGESYTGQVDHLYHMMDAESRTAKARIELPGGHNTPLKPGAYATVYLEGRESEPAPVVPDEAILTSGEEEFVVLALGEGRFQPVPVRTGPRSKDQVQILDGLTGGEEVVTSAQFLIDSEARLKNAIGSMAGSEAHDHGSEHEQEALPLAEESPSTSAVDARTGEENGEAFSGGAPLERDPSDADRTPETDRSEDTASQDIQVKRVSVGAEGFDPQEIYLEAGTPARLVFTRTTDQTCATEVSIPDFDIEEVELPQDEPVPIEILPDESGAFTVACGMHMLEGTLVVTSS